MWHCNKRPGAVAPVCVYTSDSKGSNGQVKMRQLILPGREQPMHRPERVMSNGEACFKQVAWGLSGMVLCRHQTTSFQIDMLRDSLLMTVYFTCAGAGEEWVSDKERIASNSHASTSTLYVSDVTPSSTTQHPGSYTGPAFEGAYSPSRTCSPQYIAAPCLLLLWPVRLYGLPSRAAGTFLCPLQQVLIAIMQGRRVPRLLCEILTGPGTTTPLHCALQRSGRSS